MQRPGQATIKDIARELNISPSTVSRALSDHPNISGDTKIKVAQKAKELNYHPSIVAKNLKLQKSNLIGVIVPDIALNFFAKVVSGIQDFLYENDYQVLLCQSIDSQERETKILDTFLVNRVDGIIATTSIETEKFGHFDEFISSGFPLVFFDRMPASIDNVSKIMVDNYHGAYEAVEVLVGKGHKEIICLSGPDHLSTSKTREMGYLDALKKHHLTPRTTLRCDMSLEDAEEKTAHILDNFRDINAIFAVSDRISIGVLTELQRRHLRHIYVAGFMEDIFLGDYEKNVVKITQPGYEIGLTAARTVLKAVKSQTIAEETLKPEITYL